MSNDLRTKVKMKPTKKDYFNVTIGKLKLGELERSDLRYIIQQIDNKL